MQSYCLLSGFVRNSKIVSVFLFWSVLNSDLEIFQVNSVWSVLSTRKQQKIFPSFPYYHSQSLTYVEKVIYLGIFLNCYFSIRLAPSISNLQNDVIYKVRGLDLKLGCRIFRLNFQGKWYQCLHYYVDEVHCTSVLDLITSITRYLTMTTTLLDTYNLFP